MKLKKEFMIRNIAGQDVIIATGSAAMKYNGLLTVSPTARFILEHYEEATDLSDMTRMVLEEFEVDPETAARDVAHFTQTMLERGFIELSDARKGW